MLQIKHILGVILVLNILFIAIVYDASQRVTTDAFLNQTHETTQKEASKQAFAMRPELVEEIQKYMYTEPQIISDQGDEDGKIALVSVPLEETALITNPFELLGAYPTIAKKYFNTYPDKKIMYNFTDHGLYNDDDYCERADSYNLEHPENMFEQMNFFTDYGAAEAMTRDLVIKEIGNDTMPHISIYMKSKEFNSRKYHLPLNITNYFTKRVDLHLYHQLGKHFLCATQMYNHIPGHGVIKRKDLVVGTVEKYATTFKKRPQCFKKNEFFPLSYRLYQKDECNKFFKILNSKKYQDSLATEPIQYLLKVGVGAHKAAGVSLVDKAKTEFLMNKYKNGTKCGKNLESYVAQSYVSNPLLLDRNNKFDFRIYMLVASTNPLIVYYHDGLIRVSLTPYDKFSNDRGTHLTNTALSLKKFLKESKSNDTTSDTNETTISGMNEEQAKKYMLWRFEELESYLIESGKVQDEKWLDNYLRPAFKKAFIHVSRMASASLWKQSNVYELFGLDFMLDDKMNLWLIECNSSPQLPESNGREFMVKMMKDVFEIEYAYYRSRMKRILNVIKNMQEAQAELESIDLEEWRNKYQEAAKNRIEPEYSISKDSSFTLILDENLPGDEAYFGHLPKGCA